MKPNIPLKAKPKPTPATPATIQASGEVKRNRLFLIGDLTDDTRWLCGGPDPAEATAGIIDILYDRVVDMLANGGTCELRLCVKQLTDKEVEELPEP